jgi:hypothetical protein
MEKNKESHALFCRSPIIHQAVKDVTQNLIDGKKAIKLFKE